MKITLSPVRMDSTLSVYKSGDTLILNGTNYDFSPLPDGATLPNEAIASEHFIGPVERINGELHLTLCLPHGPNPSRSVAFPELIHVVADGPVELPQ
jgi:hypothetical protein